MCLFLVFVLQVLKADNQYWQKWVFRVLIRKHLLRKRKFRIKDKLDKYYRDPAEHSERSIEIAISETDEKLQEMALAEWQLEVHGIVQL